MKKITKLLILLCSAFVAAGFASCNTDPIYGKFEGFEDYGKYTVELDSTGFNPIVPYQEESIDCSGLTLIYKMNMGPNGIYETSVPVKQEMIISGGTNVAGEQELVLSYSNYTFNVPYIVMYEVDIVAAGELLDTQYVLTGEEVVLPDETPEKNGYQFAYWKTGVLEDLKENVTVEAHYYDLSLRTPAVRTLETVYSPDATLASLTLPSNANGQWEFVDDLTTLIGGAGTHTFDVHFVASTEDMAPQANKQVTVEVEKKTVEFTMEQTSFVYDGEEHFPTPILSDPANYTTIGQPQINAGSGVGYTFTYIVEDDNYKGSYSGSYEIIKPDVEIIVDNATISYGENKPEITYTVVGFAQEKLNLLEITPNAIVGTNVGEYPISVSVGNQNVNAIVKNGALTIIRADYDWNDPVLSTNNPKNTIPVVYEDPVSTISFDGEYLGEWAWKNPDQLINDMTSVTAIAVFTPQNTNYNIVERELVIDNIIKRALNVAVINNVYTYTGAEYTIEYEVRDMALEGVVYEGLTIEGNISEILAGTYEKTLTIVSDCYEGWTAASLTIKQAEPQFELNADSADVKWKPDLTLENSGIVLGGSGIGTYVWADPTQELHSLMIGQANEFAIVFTPDDVNYHAVERNFSVTVIRADAAVNGLNDTYETTYDGNVYTLSGITASHGESELVYTYTLDGETVSGIRVAGVYTVTVTLPESEHYSQAVATAIVTINKADVNTELSVQATYEDTLADVELPESPYGVWTWQDDTQSVGDAGVNYRTAIFTATNTNYNDTQAEVTVTVAKKVLQIVAMDRTYTYDGLEQSVEYTVSDGNKVYTDLNVEGNVAYVEVGTYTVPLTINEANYEGSGSLPFMIGRATVVVSIEDPEAIAYGDDIPEADYNVTVGGEPATEYFISLLNIELVNPTVEEAGEYSIGATVDNENVNWSVEEGRLVVNKAYLNPVAPSVGSGTYSNALSTVAIEQNADNGVWTWKTPTAKLNTPTTYTATVVFTPNETNRYAVEERTVTVTVDKKELSITVTASEFDYNTEEQTVVYYIGDGHSYNDVEVVGVPSGTNAGDYPSTITIVDDRYFGETAVTLKILPIDPEDEDFSTVYTKVWYDGLTLADIALPKDYRWIAPETALNAIGTASYEAVYEKIDEYNNVLGNYNVVYDEFSVTVQKSDVFTAMMTVTSYDCGEYEDGAIYVLSDIITLADLAISHNEAVTLSYKVNGETVETLTSAGLHTVEVTVSGSTHYNGKVVGEVTVNIDYADIEEVTDLTHNPYYETAIEDLALPTEGTAYGEWAWISVNAEGDDALTRWLDVGTYTAVAKFTATDPNFNDTTAAFTVTINAKPLTISAVVKTYTYIKNTSQNLEYVITDSEGKVYTDLEVNGDIAHENANTYPMTITIANSNYTGELSTNFVINPTTDGLADGEITIPTWVYDNAPTLYEEAVSGNEVYFVYSDTIDGNYTPTIPNAAGPHYVMAKTNGSQNYKPLETEPVEFWILEDTVHVTVGQIMATKEFVNADIQLTNADLTDTRYTVQSSDTGFDIGTYNATLVLKPAYKDNYQFTNRQDTIDVKFVIEPTDKNDWDIDPTIAGWEFIEGTKAPEMNKGLAYFGGIPEVRYVLEGTTEELVELPAGVPAGTHTALFIIAPHANYNGLTKPVTFIVDPQDVSVSIPWLDYNGEPQDSGLSDETSPLYDFVEEVGGTEVDDECYVILKLLNTKNYEWKVGEIFGADSEFTKIYYSIHSAEDNDWKIAPSIEGWTYKEGNKSPNYEARYGNDEVSVEYLLEGENNRRKPEELPEHIPAGYHKVYFSLEATGDYNGIPETEVPFMVEKANHLKETDTTTTTGVGVYSHTLSTVTLVQNNLNGTWTWKTPDSAIEWTTFPTSGTLTATAVFTPNETDNYHVQTRQVVYTVEKLTLTVTAGRTETVYNDEWQEVDYTIEGGYEVQDVEVLGGEEADTYEGFVTIVDERYQGSAAATLFIDKDTPSYVFDKSYTITWEEGLKLSAVTGLPAGCTWVDGDTSLDDIKTDDYAVVYNKGKNYHPVYGTFSVTVNRSDDYSATMLETYYETDQYEDGKTYALSDIITLEDLAISHNEAVTLSYKVNGTTVETLTSAGTHTVEVIVSGSTHYNGKIVDEVTVFIDYADIEEVTDLTRTPDYETAIEDLALPTEGTAYGAWAWISVNAEGDDALTRWLDVGTYTAVAAFTATNPNFNDTTATFTVTIGRKTIDSTFIPSISAQTYTTKSWVEWLNEQVPDTTYYMVSLNETIYDYTCKGTHKVTLTATDNYRWGVENDNDITVKEIDFVINQATDVTVTAPTMEGWTYAFDQANVKEADGSTAYITVDGEKYYLPETVIEYRYSTSKDGTYYSYEDIVIKGAGTYYAKAFVEVSPDYVAGSSVATSFVVDKAPLSKPNVNSQYYTGEDLTPVVDIEKEAGVDLYTPGTLSESKYAGTYNVTLTLTETAKNNYYWEGDATKKVLTTTVTFTILKQMNVVVESVTIDGWEYKQSAKIPTIELNVVVEDTDITYTYYKVDGTFVGTIDVNGNLLEGTWPKAAGDYYVIANIADDGKNYASATSEPDQGTFTITKKVLPIPEDVSFVYGSELPQVTVEKEDGVALYEVDYSAVEDKVGTYDVTLTLTETAKNNYYWADDNTQEEIAATVKFTVTAATTEIVSLSITGWEYGKKANTPTATAYLVVSATNKKQLATNLITYKYSATENGTYTETLPLNDEGYVDAGTWYVKAYVADNEEQYEGCETAEAASFVITRKTYTPSTPIKIASQTYTGQPLTADISDTTQYKATNKQYTVAGPHPVTLTTTDNYRWGVDTEGKDITVTTVDFVINQATNITVNTPTGTFATWTYGDTIDKPFKATAYITVNGVNYDLPESAIEFVYSKTENGTYSALPAKPDAVTWWVKAVVKATDNYATIVNNVAVDTFSAPKSFKIEKATPTATPRTYAATYENKFNANTYVTNHSASVAGAWTYGVPVFDVDNDGETTTSVTATFSAIFTPTDATNYNVVEKTATVTLKAAAHIDSNYYGTIEIALTKASSGQTVMVCLDTAEEIWITTNCTIPAGVTLTIPFEFNGQEYTGYSNGTGTEGWWDCDKSNDGWQANGTNVVRVRENVEITIRGTLNVCGATSGGNGGQKYAGHTVDNLYADVRLDANAKIKVYGSLCIWGFIRESALNNGSKITVENGGKMYQPFVLRDFRGGTYMSAIYNAREKYRISPFNQFTLPNVSSLVQIVKGGELHVYASLYANDKRNDSDSPVKMVGNSGEFLIQFKGSESYLTAKYNEATEICDLNLYGDATINSLTLNVIGINISTSEVMFPLSWRHHITLNDGEFNSGCSFKLMPGAQLALKNASLSVTELIAYGNDFSDEGVTSKSITGSETTFEAYGAGKSLASAFILFKAGGGVSRITATNLGGKVCVESGATAVVNVTGAVSMQSWEAKRTEFQLLNFSGVLVNQQDYLASLALYDENNQLWTPVGATTYNYASGEGWYRSVNVKYSTTNGSVDTIQLNSNHILTQNELPTLTQAGYAFEGWYLDAKCEQPALGGGFMGRTLSAEVTLYAKWTAMATAYKVSVYKISGEGFDLVGTLEILETATLTQDMILALITQDVINAQNNDKAKTWYYTGEWYTNQACTSKFTESVLSGNISLYPGHGVKVKINVTTSNASVGGVVNGGYYTPGSVINPTVTYTQNSSQTFTVNGSKHTSGADYIIPSGVTEITINASSSSCVVEGTLITLADGTQKAVEDLTGEELLLVWNLETGTYDVAPIVFVDSDPRTNYEVINLHFSNGTVVGVISEHGFFDIDLGKYVYLDAFNAKEYIGHRFITEGSIENNTWNAVTLTDVVIEVIETRAFSPVTFSHLCYYVNGVLSMPGGIEGLFNIFEVDVETMSYDAEKKAQDIETYGLFTYEDFGGMIPEIAFEAFNGAYLKVAMGKGMIDWATIEMYANRYIPLM